MVRTVGTVGTIGIVGLVGMFEPVLRMTLIGLVEITGTVSVVWIVGPFEMSWLVGMVEIVGLTGMPVFDGWLEWLDRLDWRDYCIVARSGRNSQTGWNNRAFSTVTRHVLVWLVRIGLLEHFGPVWPVLNERTGNGRGINLLDCLDCSKWFN